MDGRTWTGAVFLAQVRLPSCGWPPAVPDTSPPASVPSPASRHGRIGGPFAEATDPTDGRIITAIGAGPEGFVILMEGFESPGPRTAYASANGVDWYEATAGGWDVEWVAPVGPDWVAMGRGPFDDEWRDTETFSWVSPATGSTGPRPAGFRSGPCRSPQGSACREFLSEPVSAGRTVVVVLDRVVVPLRRGPRPTLRRRPRHAGWRHLGGAPVHARGEARRTTARAARRSMPGLDLGSGTLLVGERRTTGPPSGSAPTTDGHSHMWYSS